MPPLIIPSNRHSAPVTTGPSADASSRLDLGAVSAARRTTSVGRPVSLTLPPSAGPSSTAPASGLESMTEGLEKTSRAQVDVARRAFWRKCLGTTVMIAGVALMSVATAGVGTAGLVGMGLLGGLALKGSGDSVLSLMNWRNKKAEHLGQKPPFEFLNRLPEAVRQDATAVGLMGLGMSQRKASLTSKVLEATLGLSALALMGYDSGGALGAALAPVPIFVEMGFHALNHRMEERRQRHVEGVHGKMAETSAETEKALAQLEDLRERLQMQAADLTPSEASGEGGATHAISELQQRVKQLQSETLEMTNELHSQVQERVQRKAAAGTSGLGAVLLDSASESGITIVDGIIHSPVHVLSMGVGALRSGLEFARTLRSEKRDNAKLQVFDELHRDLRAQVSQMQQELESEIGKLERLSQEARSESAASAERTSSIRIDFA